MIQAVTFDVTHTLIHSPRLGEIYAGVLRRHGVEIDAEEARRLISVVWQELLVQRRSGARPLRRASGGGARLVAPVPRAAVRAERGAAPLAVRGGGALPPLRHGGGLGGLSGGDEGARGARAAGAAAGGDQQLGPPPAGAADRRLRLAKFFGSITYSAKAGVEKPDRRIFLQALAELGVEPGAALHVGDGRLEDVEGAVAAGMKALHLTRNTGGGDLRDLAGLPELVEAERAGRAGRQWAGGMLDF